MEESLENISGHKKIRGPDIREYQVAIDSTGTMKDLLHPLARYDTIYKTYASSFKNFQEEIPLAFVRGVRPRIHRLLGVKEFMIMVTVTNRAEAELPRNEQEKKIDSLIAYLKER